MKKKRAQIIGGGKPGEYGQTEVDPTGLEAPLDPNAHPVDATVSPKFQPPEPLRDEEHRQADEDGPKAIAKRGRGKGAAHE